MEETFATKGTSPYIAAILIADFWQMAGYRYYFTPLRGGEVKAFHSSQWETALQ